MEPWIIVSAVIVMMVLIIIAVVRAEKKRREAFKNQAMRLGFTYAQKADMTEVQAAQAFPLFQRGHTKRISNFMQRQSDGLQIAVYDYRYTVGGGKNSHTHRQTIYQFQSSRLKLPDFELKPEHLFHKIGQKFGYQDIDFESFPDFSKQYLLRGKDETMIRKLFNQEVIVRFESELKWNVEAGGESILFFHDSKRIKPDELYTMFEKARALCQMFVSRSDYL